MDGIFKNRYLKPVADWKYHRDSLGRTIKFTLHNPMKKYKNIDLIDRVVPEHTGMGARVYSLFCKVLWAG